MGITYDRNDPELKEIKPDGQQKAYLALSKEEREKGFVRPVRRSYKHVGLKKPENLRDLTPEEAELYKGLGYVKYEAYPEGHHSYSVGRFWTQADLDNRGCGVVTTMGQALAETYARQPSFYSATFCCGCGKHLPVAEFVWDGTDETVGS